MVKTISIKTQVLSPYIFFVIAWIVVILLYDLHWSYLLPPLTTMLDYSSGVQLLFVLYCFITLNLWSSILNMMMKKTELVGLVKKRCDTKRCCTDSICVEHSYRSNKSRSIA